MIVAPSRPRYDAVVVGARCAGSATAMLLARQGLAVLCIEQGRPGSDTLSTHALMRGGVLLLHRWGVLEALREAGTPKVARTYFHYGDDIVDVEIRPRDGIDGLYAPRRKVIDPILAAAAVAAGVELIYGARLVELARDGEGRVCGVGIELEGERRVEVACGIVIGADGVRSTVARLVGAAPYVAATHTTSLIYSYFAGVELDGYHWYYRTLPAAAAVSAGAIATNGGTCVFAATTPERFAALRHDLAAAHGSVLAQCDAALARAVARAERVDRYRAFAGLPGFLRPAWGPGWALVGDAGYFKDPITAHGITDALVDAQQLADAVARGSEAALAHYQAERDARGRPLFEVTDAVASLTWDIPSLQQLHASLSEVMKRETAALTNRAHA
jgi:2-polyprenyl-6-methoxyphenol hydroxylase-like FAD-dependent oxidoreductase